MAAACWSWPAKAVPVYGVDDRKDIYEIADPEILKLERGVAALFYDTDFETKNGSTVLIKTAFNPMEKLAPSERFQDQPQEAYCTGFLVASDLLMTAGHCLGKDEHGTEAENCKATRFVFDYAVLQKGMYPEKIPAENIYFCARILDLRDPPEGRGIFHLKTFLTRDWALVKLDRPASGRQPLTLADRDAQREEAVFTIGCGLGLPLKFADDAQVTSFIREMFTSNLDSFSGSSGSPVFSARTRQVIGIFAGGNDADLIKSKEGMKVRTYSQKRSGGVSTRISVIIDKVKEELDARR